MPTSSYFVPPVPTNTSETIAQINLYAAPITTKLELEIEMLPIN
jgi:hypothetical protein